jgi:hypothetical protein
MNKKDSERRVSEIGGLKEYNEFYFLCEQAKEFINELEFRAYAERKTDLQIVAFKKNVSPIFIAMIGLVDKLISQNLIDAQKIVRLWSNQCIPYKYDTSMNHEPLSLPPDDDDLPL